MAIAAKATHVPPTEVSPKASRRRFSAKYKRRVLREVDACSESGEIAALLRREGLYSSHLTNWRQARDRGQNGMRITDARSSADPSSVSAP